MPHSRRASHALTVLKVAVVGSATGLVLASTLDPGTAADPATAQERLEQTKAAASRLASRTGGLTECDSAGAPRGSALVRSPAGRMRVVTFERGWSVYKGERPGTLVAVCSAGS